MRTSNNLAARARAALGDNRGFTLLELVIVLVIVSIMTLLVAPRLSVFLSGSRSNFIILQSIVAKSFDDAFIRNRTNFLVVHMGDSISELTDLDEKIFSRKNGVSVVNFSEGSFRDSPNPLLKYRRFPGSFRFEEVIMASGEKITSGNVLIPFYPRGHSDDVIVHILANDDERYSMRISKYRKTPKFVPDYVNFDTEAAE
jgi:prepilin-type N-terminal cleavage/methylation domain-containing protein